MNSHTCSSGDGGNQDGGCEGNTKLQQLQKQHKSKVSSFAGDTRIQK